MSKDDPNDWGPGEVSERVNLIYEGKAYAGDVLKLLELFCSQAKEPQPLDSPISARLLDYIRTAFHSYLSGDAQP